MKQYQIVMGFFSVSLVFGGAGLVLPNLAHAAQVQSRIDQSPVLDEKYYTVGEVQVRELDEGDLLNRQKMLQDDQCDDHGKAGDKACKNNGAVGPGVDKLPRIFPALDPRTVEIDAIINLGEKVWKIIEAGRPVVNFKTDSASALPKGAQSWRQLEGWQTPKSKIYEVAYKNLYGITVVDFSFRVLYTYGGNVRGVGRYLTNVTIVPANLSVAWGYKFNAEATVPNVVNAGSRGNPVGAMELLMNWKLDTVFKHMQSTMSFYVRGDGAFQNLTNGN